MRTLIGILLIGLLGNMAFAQIGMTSAQKNDAFNKKGDYFFNKSEWEKAIVYYNMAYQSVNSDVYPILRKAEAYNNLGHLHQAEECYRIAFDSRQKIDNLYKLKYAIVLLKNNKKEEYEQWLKKYNLVIEEDIRGGNYISADRIKLYKDSTFVVVMKATGSDNMKVINNKNMNLSQISIDNFVSDIKDPVLNSIGNTLYFVSDAPGGNGKNDIYRSRLIDNKWTVPVNLGNDINTRGNDISPYILNDSILYFASDSRNQTGGYDIYKVNLKYADKEIVRLGSPLNTAFDDFGLKLENDGQTGYFYSNRPGGTGQDDIYKVVFIPVRMKYAYIPRVRTNMEDDKINLMLSSGEEYNIASSGNVGFEFDFKPEQDYKIILQQENIACEGYINNKTLTAEQLKNYFLNPEPLQKAEIPLTPGLKYQFVSGDVPMSSGYISSLKKLADKFQNPGKNTINLNVLAKELKFNENGIYTIWFVKNEQSGNYKAKSSSALVVNRQEVALNGESFFIVLPLKTESNFRMQTDLASLEQDFNPSKYAVNIDEGAVFGQDKGTPANYLSLVINTDSIEEVKPSGRFFASSFSIIPGAEYIMALSKVDAFTDERIEIIVPLTRGVKYNLSSTLEPDSKYKKALAEFLIGRKGVQPDGEEVIDISVLSKELEVQPGEELSFSLTPVKMPGMKTVVNKNIRSKITVDGKDQEILSSEKMVFNIPVSVNWKVNLQTDLNYIQDNFENSSFSMDVDTIPFFSEITVDTTGYSALRESGWLVSMNVNTESTDEVESKNHLTAKEVSIIPGKEYILTVSKIDGITGKEDEIIVPLTRKVKYDFTSDPASEEAYKESLNKFLQGREDIETIDGELIDINLLSKELQIKEGDEVSFSLLPVKELNKKKTGEVENKSSLYLDNNIVEFTHIQKYTINVPLSQQRHVNIQTDIDYIEDNFSPEQISIDVDTIEFFSEITVDTTGYGSRVMHEEDVITDPIFDVIVVNFNLNEYTLLPEARKIIDDKVIAELKKDNRLYVTIKGYTDALGNADYNLKLSRNRAETVKKYLSENGIGQGRIRTFSFGESQTLGKGVKWEDLSEDELKKHRKVEIVIYLPK